MVVKSHSVTQHVADLQEAFREIQNYDMHLNLEKCTFGVGDRNFVRFIITHRGIEANFDKCTSILEMHSPTNVREVQKLNNRLVVFVQVPPKARREGEAILQATLEN